MLLVSSVQVSADPTRSFDFYGDSLKIQTDYWQSIRFDKQNWNADSVIGFYKAASMKPYQALVNRLLYYRQKNKLDDWFYYQLVRKTAQEICAKQENFELYTLYKWFLMCKSGFDARLAISEHKLLFYVRSDDNIYDIPFFRKNGRQYVCLNYHDYGSQLDFDHLSFFEVPIEDPEAVKNFSYRVTRMPDFTNEQYQEQDIRFAYGKRNYTFKVMVNPDVQNIFVNYPVVDYEAYFNIPLSKKTYNSLIPELKEAVKGMSQKKGVDYLMRFSRNAFAYKNDQEQFGREKRLAPEQMLQKGVGDCDDRAAFFFSLVKEIYNLPMIVLLYPKHVTIAVQFQQQAGKPIIYKDKKYYVCEPTPQIEDLPIGRIAHNLKHTPYEVAYDYNPDKR
ncbi:hypothetical protein GCM10023092_22040 [Rurimicrobium arvi]|uniref:Transglutaminase-like superfamily protein n=2 Tax=Rurimicrobium arvi TaxID=2049916 RepID=A0ABP8MXV7_9BACT